MSRTGASRTRTKCANPELLSWLGELRDETEEDSNYRMVLGRAYKSMKEYPDVLERIEDAVRIKNIGPKIISKLKEKQKEKTGFMSAHLNLPSTAGPSTSTATESAPKKRGRPKKADGCTTTPLNRQVSAPSVMNTSGHAKATPRARQASGAAAVEATVEYAPPPGAPLTDSDPFLFTYLNRGSQPVRRRDDAHFEEKDLKEPGYLIQYSTPYDKHPITEKLIGCFPIGGKFQAYLPMIFALEMDTSPLPTSQPAPPPPTPKAAPPQAEKRKLSDLLDAENRADAAQKRRNTGSLNPARQLPVQPPGLASTSFATARKPMGRSATMPAMNNSMPPPAAPSAAEPITRTTSLPNNARAQRNKPRLSSALPTMEIEVDLEDPYASAEHMEIPKFNPIVIPAEGYDIKFVLDIREVKSRKDRDWLADKLASKGIPVVKEPLEIGDVAWKAVRKHKRGDEYDEVVLDVILERKRFDDLWMSIKEGRFHEQKFRLHNSAVTKVFYLVEAYDRNKREDAKNGTMGKAFDTAISSTQVVDHFRVKETSHINDTIAYYTTLHAAVLDRYRNKPLNVLPSELIRRQTYLKLQKGLRRREPHREYLTTFAAFQLLNTKSGFTTIRETWARQLLRVNSMSAEKAGAVVQRYPCPRALRDAFKEDEEREREERALEEMEARVVKGGRRKKSQVRPAKHLLKDVGQGVRMVGESLSEKVYELMMSEQYAER
ncbi:ERCC4 domain-containing protein [Schizophyllum commune]